METAGSDFGSECYRSVQQEEALSGGKHKLGSGKLCVGDNCFCYEYFLTFISDWEGGNRPIPAIVGSVIKSRNLICVTSTMSTIKCWEPESAPPQCNVFGIELNSD